ncbi:MAG: hypothetical protein KJ645_06865 [Planctomycetes bacterium]|nr:hypothetical protein [Planctomycetota bacterium]
MFLPSVIAFADPAEREKTEVASCIQNPLSRLPLYFVENRGQMDDEVAYHVKGSDKSLFFTSRGITLALKGNEDQVERDWVVKLSFEDADRVNPRAENKQKAVFSYFTGNKGDWHTGCATYGRLVYEDLWPGIDLVYKTSINRLKYEFHVKPGADPSRIRLAYQGVEGYELTPSERLRIHTPAAGFEDGKPVAYQYIDGERVEISMRYDMALKSGEGDFSYGFEVGSHDPTATLVLDPALLVYCGYIGGLEKDAIYDIALDAQGRQRMSQGGLFQDRIRSEPLNRFHPFTSLQYL